MKYCVIHFMMLIGAFVMYLTKTYYLSVFLCYIQALIPIYPQRGIYIFNDILLLLPQITADDLLLDDVPRDYLTMFVSHFPITIYPINVHTIYFVNYFGYVFISKWIHAIHWTTFSRLFHRKSYTCKVSPKYIGKHITCFKSTRKLRTASIFSAIWCRSTQRSTHWVTPSACITSRNVDIAMTTSGCVLNTWIRNTDSLPIWRMKKTSRIMA